MARKAGKSGTKGAGDLLPISAQKLGALKHLIGRAQTITDLTKRVLWRLLDSSEGLTRSVNISLRTDGYSKDDLDMLRQDLLRSRTQRATLNLDALMALVGRTIDMSCLMDGDEACTCVLWLADTKTLKVTTSKQRLERYNFDKPGFLPNVE